MSVRTGLTGAAVVAAVTAAALTAPASAAPRAAGHSATRQAMDAAVKTGVPGVTATARDGHGTWKATSGVGDLRSGRPRSAQDRYRVGSITKTFVSTVLLQLEAEGRLSLDDRVDKWLPGVVRGHGHDGRRITVRQILNHTSGVYDYTADDSFVRTYFLKDGFFRHRYDTLAPQDLVRIAVSHKPEFAPGTSWSYSNTNYVLAGMVIERVTGHSYAREIRDRVIAPLGCAPPRFPARAPRFRSRAAAPTANSRRRRPARRTTSRPSIPPWRPRRAG
ncbi:serine hydrolase domain-containing protein [Streptomyces sp. CA-106131]|uniref:serine hydrolase domain-containing protein n=1 Tax=Streptomyces sp. CA-106131 TaxID=3240045 RepID=UPI003D8DC0E1